MNGKDEGNSEVVRLEREIRRRMSEQRCFNLRVKIKRVWITASNQRDIRDHMNEAAFGYLSVTKMIKLGFRTANK